MTLAGAVKVVISTALFLCLSAIQLSAQAPYITSISPNTSVLGSGPFTLTVLGDFTSSAVVRWNGVDRPTFPVYRGLGASISAEDVGRMESVSITVFDTNVSNSVDFTIYAGLSATTNDLVYDRFSKRMYASVPGSLPNGNSILPINPFTLSTGTPVFIGSEPGKIVLSDDGQYLYAALNGAASIRRFNLSTQTAGLQFTLGNNLFSFPNLAQDLEVVPGNASAVAVLLGPTGGPSEVAVFDDGVKRPVYVPLSYTQVIEFSNSGSTLYGYDKAGNVLKRMSVDASGVSVTQSSGFDLVSGSDIRFGNSRVYTTIGQIIDPQTFTNVGSFPLPGPAELVLPDPGTDRMFFLSLTGQAAAIHVFNATSQALVGRIDIPGVTIPDPSFRVSSFIRWGDDGLAFRTTANQIFLLRVPPAWLGTVPALSVSPVSIVFPGQPVGNPSASIVNLTNNSNASIPINGITTSGDFSQSNDCGSLLAALTSCSITVTFVPTAQGPRSGILTISDGTPASPHIVGLSGAGNITIPVPFISAISSDSAIAGSSGFALTVTGGNFVPGSVIRWNGSDRQTTFVSGNQLRAAIASSDLSGLQSATVSVFNPAPGPVTSNAVSFIVYGAIKQPTKDLVYDPLSRRIYASVPGSIAGGNSITPIDPVTVRPQLPIWIGSEPGRLALSDNGQYLYVSLDEAAAVRRLDLTTQTAGPQFTLGSDPRFGPYAPREIVVLPGSATTVAVSGGGIAIYDNGVKRAGTTTPEEGVDLLAFSDSGDVLYGVTTAQFRTMSVSAGGVAVTSVDNISVPVGAEGAKIKFEGGRIYTAGGVLDAGTHKLMGTFRPPRYFFGRSHVTDLALDRVFVLTQDTDNGSKTYIYVFNPTTFTVIGKIVIPIDSYGLSSLIRWGDDGLAFRNDLDDVVLLRIPRALLPSGPPLSISQTNSLFAVQPVGTTSPVQTITITNNTNAPVAITSIKTTGDFNQTNNCGAAVAALASCNINVTFTPTLSGMRAGTLSIVHGGPTSPYVVGLSGPGNTSTPVPSITSLSPDSGPTGSAGFTLTVAGTNFVTGSVVRWNGVDRPTTFVNSNTLTAPISAGSLTGLDSASVTVFNPPPDGGLSNAAIYTTYRALTLSINDLVYDRFSRRIYASIPAPAPSSGNTIVPVDPASQTLGSPIPIGFEPSRLALSDNGQYLYTSQRSGNSIRRIDLASQTPGLQFALGGPPSHPYLAWNIRVQPGAPATLAVSRDYDGGVAIYDDGVQRATATPFETNLIEFSDSPGILYGIENTSSGFAFRTMSIDSAGVTITNTSNYLLPGFFSQMKFENGRVYAPTGMVADPATRTRIGKFPLAGVGLMEAMVPDSTVDCVFFIRTSYPYFEIQAFNRTNFTFIGSLRIPNFIDFSVRALVRWGGDGLAFGTDNRVFLLRIPSTWITVAPPRRRGQITSQ